MKQITQQHMLYLGTVAILVQDEAFQHGYQQGQQRFQQKYAGQKLDDQAIHDFICRNITNVMASERENAGYITGWFAALLRQEGNGQAISTPAKNSRVVSQ